MIFFVQTFAIIHFSTHASRRQKKADIKDYTNIDQEIVIGKFNRYIEFTNGKKSISYILHELIKNSNYVCVKFEIEPAFRCTKSL